MLELWLGRTALRVSFGFLAMLALLCLWDTAGLVVPFLLACTCHELGHLLCMCLCGLRPAAILCSGAGIRIRLQQAGILSMGREALVLLSGPAVNLLLGLCFLTAGAETAAFVQLLLGGWNLLPYRSLDGGALLRSLLTYRGADGGMVWLKLTLTLGTIMFVWLSWRAGLRNPQLLVMLLYLAACEWLDGM